MAHLELTRSEMRMTKADALARQNSQLAHYVDAYGDLLVRECLHASTPELLADGHHPVSTINRHILRGGAIEEMIAEIQTQRERDARRARGEDPFNGMGDTGEENGPWSVAIYLCDRAYGGPEEGGWWYDTGEPSLEHIEHVRCFHLRSAARAYAHALRSSVCEELNQGRRSINSVLSEGQYFPEVQEGLPQAYPQGRPRYE